MALELDTNELERRLGRLLNRTAKARAAKRAALEHVTMLQEAFNRSGVDPETGTPGVWPDKKTGERSILQDTGQLVDSIDFVLEDDGYTVGPGPLPYAAVHQHGAANIPARPYMVLPEPWKQLIWDVYIESLMGEEGRSHG
ncbi:MAG: phage virion morphogenesis protein [Vicinamibacterales bacterium]